MKNRDFRTRLGFAFAGIATVWRRERSFRTQSARAAVALAALFVLKPGAVWSALICIAIVLVLALELLNSALEYWIDHLHPGIAEEIRAAKDAAAGAVLIASLGAFAIGGLLVLALATGRS